MRIVHLVGWYFPQNIGGTEIYVRELARHQRAAGHDVAIAAPLAGLRSPEMTEHDSTPVFRYPIPMSPSRDEAQGLQASAGTEHLVRWLEGRRADVAHAHSFVTGLGIRELEVARARGARIVVTHHLPSLGYLCRRGTLIEDGTTACDGVCEPRRCARCVLSQRGLGEGIARAVAVIPRAVSRAAGRLPGKVGTALGMAASIVNDQEQQRRLFEIADVQVVLNETARRILAANGFPVDRVVVNRLGISGGPYGRKPAAATSAPVVFGSLSRFHEIKGLVELVRAARRVPRDIDFRLDIRGPVQSAADRRFADGLRMAAAGDTRISVSPGPEHEDVPTLLSSFDLLCCVPASFENGPTVALEAMAVGTPLLATRVGNLAEIVNDTVNGRLVPLRDEAALARAIREIASNPDQIDAWRTRLAPPRTMDQVAADYEPLYAGAVAKTAA